LVLQWGGTEARGTTAGEPEDPASRGSTAFGSKSQNQTPDNEEGETQNGRLDKTKKSGFSDLFRRGK
jgi:hypothetical protein